MPAIPIAPLDELSAVNEMLTSIGQTPVQSLTVHGIGDVALAHQFLTSVTRSTQLVGWDFNTDDSYTLTPDASGIIRVPDGVLRIDPVVKTSGFKRRRHPDGYWAIWNGDDQTWVFEAPEDFRIVWAYPFDDMPDSARHFVSLSAARRFQMKLIGSNSLDGFGAEDENSAWVILQRDERSGRDTNVFRRNTTMAAAVANRQY